MLRCLTAGSTETFDQGTKSPITENDDGDTAATDDDVSMLTENADS